MTNKIPPTVTVDNEIDGFRRKLDGLARQATDDPDDISYGTSRQQPETVAVSRAGLQVFLGQESNRYYATAPEFLEIIRFLDGDNVHGPKISMSLDSLMAFLHSPESLAGFLVRCLRYQQHRYPGPGHVMGNLILKFCAHTGHDPIEVVKEATERIRGVINNKRAKDAMESKPNGG